MKNFNIIGYKDNNVFNLVEFSYTHERCKRSSSDSEKNGKYKKSWREEMKVPIVNERSNTVTRWVKFNFSFTFIKIIFYHEVYAVL